MKTSLVMAACNQGRFLAETIDSAMTDGFSGIKGNTEIIVVNDMSTDGSCDNLPDHVTIIDTDKQMGCAQSRKLGAEKSSGDVVIIADPHCSFEKRSLARLSAVAAKKQAIIQPKVKWEDRGGLSFGGAFQMSYRGLRIRLTRRQFKYMAMYGTIYAMERKIMSHLEFPWLPGVWGRWEQITSLQAIRYGIPILVAGKLLCTHRRYRKHSRFPYPMPIEDPVRNSHWMHASMFPKTYKTHWIKLLHRKHGDDPKYERDLDTDQFKEYCETVQRKSTMTEEELIRKILKKDIDELPFFNGK